MTVSAQEAIKTALLAHMQGLSFSPAIPVQWSGVPFTAPNPTPGAVWLRASIMMADAFSLGVNTGNRHSGYFQVDVFCWGGAGELVPTRTAATVIASFKKQTTLFQDGFKIVMWQPPSPQSLMVEDDWLHLPIKIPFRCYAPNPS